MKKTIKFILSLFLAITLIQGYSSEETVTKLAAEGTYPMACSNYEVDVYKRQEEERLPAVSVGWTLAQNEPVADVIAQADQKMYEHKRRHKSDLLP